MLLVRNYVARSPIHGVGVFAAEPVARGTAVWRYNPVFDIVIPLHHAETLPASAQEFLKRYAYKSALVGGNLLMDADNGRFMNHSASPNTDNAGWVSVATRDIAQDEEITCDYGEFYEDFELLP